MGVWTEINTFRKPNYSVGNAITKVQMHGQHCGCVQIALKPNGLDISHVGSFICGHAPGVPGFEKYKYIEKYSKIFFRTTGFRLLKFGM